MAYAFLGQCLDAAFRSDMQEVFFGSNTRMIIGAPKPFQRMQNKLLNPKEHGDASLARPRCAMNLDVLRGCIVVETIQELESTFRKLQSTYKVVRAENTHDPSEHGRNSSKKRRETENHAWMHWFDGVSSVPSGFDSFRKQASAGRQLGHRCLLVNFVYEPGLTWMQLLGGSITFDLSDDKRTSMNLSTPVAANQNHLGNLWVDFVEGNVIAPSLKNILALQGLQRISRDYPNEPVRIIAELQFVLRPYFNGKVACHLLNKIARCETG